MVLPTAEPDVRVSRAPARMRWIAAAAALLVSCVALSAALPGSPVREWLGATIGALMSPVSESESAPAPGNAASPSEPASVGVTVSAADGAVIVDIEAPDPALELRVSTAETHAVRVDASGAAAAARFRSAAGRLTIVGPGAGVIALVIPRDVQHATLRIDGLPYLVKDRTALHVLASFADTSGHEITLRLGSPAEPAGRIR